MAPSPVQYMPMNDASPTASGASNASDFQPLTQNPQSTGSNLQPTTADSNADRLDQLPASQLTVETAQASADSQISQITAPRNTFVSFLPFIVILVVALILFRRWNFFVPQSQEAPAPVEVPEPTVAKTPKRVAKKPTNSRPKKKTKTKK
jgi:hypothetical protein